MKIAEITDNIDVGALIERAEVEIKADLSGLKSAESSLTAALEEKSRVMQIMARLQSELATAIDVAGAAKQAWLRSSVAADGAEDHESLIIYRVQREERERLTALLAYAGTWSAEDAARGEIVARMERDSAESAALETRACLVRLQLIQAAGAAMAADPGANINTDSSWSQQALRASALLAENAGKLRDALMAHDSRVVEQRSLVAPRLFNA